MMTVTFGKFALNFCYRYSYSSSLSLTVSGNKVQLFVWSWQVFNSAPFIQQSVLKVTVEPKLNTIPLKDSVLCSNWTDTMHALSALQHDDVLWVCDWQNLLMSHTANEHQALLPLSWEPPSSHTSEIITYLHATRLHTAMCIWVMRRHFVMLIRKQFCSWGLSNRSCTERISAVDGCYFVVQWWDIQDSQPTPFEWMV